MSACEANPSRSSKQRTRTFPANSSVLGVTTEATCEAPLSDRSRAGHVLPSGRSVSVPESRGRYRATFTGHATALPAPDESEGALTVHTIYFWPDLRAGLREIHRILIPGGRVAIAYRPTELGLPRRRDPQIYRGPTTDILTKAIRSNGFLDITVHKGQNTSVVLAHTPDRTPTDPSGDCGRHCARSACHEGDAGSASHLKTLIL